MVDHFHVQERFVWCRKTLLGSRAANGPYCLVNNILLVANSFNSGFSLTVLGLEMTNLISFIFIFYNVVNKLDFPQKNYIEEMIT